MAKSEQPRAEEEPRKRRLRNVLVGASVVVLVIVGLGWISHRKQAAIAASDPRGTGAAASSPSPAVAGLVVGFELAHGSGFQDGATALEGKGARTRLVEQALSDDTLRGLDVLVLLEPRRTPLTPREIDAVERFIAAGGGLIVADVGGSWATHAKRPIEELYANVLGQRLGYVITSENIGPDARVDAAVVAGITQGRLARNDWVPARIEVTGEHARVVVRDERMRPMAGTVEHGKGHVAVFGHPGMLLENPPLFVWAVSFAGGRAKR
jgi:hypothetical protein